MSPLGFWFGWSVLPLEFWGSGNWCGLWNSGSQCALWGSVWPLVEWESSAGVMDWDINSGFYIEQILNRCCVGGH